MTDPPGLPFFADISVATPADATIAKRIAEETADRLLFPPQRAAEVALIASELAYNHVVHRTQNGRIRIAANQIGDAPFLSVASLDHGPGISDLALALSGKTPSLDGLGKGLGAVARLSDEFHICSSTKAPTPCPPWNDSRGTIVVSTLWASPRIPEVPGAPALDLGLLVRPRRKAAFCGDGVRVQCDGRYLRVSVADGAGPGPSASAATASVFAELDRLALLWPPENLLEAVEPLVAGTAGLALHVLLLDLRTGVLQSAGRGNIRVMLGLDGHFFALPVRGGAVGDKRWGHPRGEIHPPAAHVTALVWTDGHRDVPDPKVFERALHGHGGARTYPSAILLHSLFRPEPSERDDATLVVWQWKRL